MDTRQRELERRAKTGDLEARVQWLQARERGGSLSRSKIEIAAACGDLAARRLVHSSRWKLALKLRQYFCVGCMNERSIYFDMFEPYQCPSCGTKRQLKGNVTAVKQWLAMLRDWGKPTVCAAAFFIAYEKPFTIRDVHRPVLDKLRATMRAHIYGDVSVEEVRASMGAVSDADFMSQWSVWAQAWFIMAQSESIVTRRPNPHFWFRSISKLPVWVDLWLDLIEHHVSHKHNEIRDAVAKEMVEWALV